MRDYLRSFYWNNLPVKNPVQNRYIRFQQSVADLPQTIYDKIRAGMDKKLGEFPEHRYSSFFKEVVK